MSSHFDVESKKVEFTKAENRVVVRIGTGIRDKMEIGKMLVKGYKI